MKKHLLCCFFVLSMSWSCFSVPPGGDNDLQRPKPTWGQGRNFQRRGRGAFAWLSHCSTQTQPIAFEREGPAVRDAVAGQCRGCAVCQAGLLLVDAVSGRQQSEGVHGQCWEVLELTQLSVQPRQAVLNEVHLLCDLPDYRAHVLRSRRSKQNRTLHEHDSHASNQYDHVNFQRPWHANKILQMPQHRLKLVCDGSRTSLSSSATILIGSISILQSR